MTGLTIGGNYGAPTWSPDGRYLIFSGGVAGGVFPIWSRTGHELFYQSGDQIMTVSYTVNGDSFMPEKPRVWAAKLGGLASNGTRRFDVAPDGSLAVLTPVEAVQAPKVDHHVVFVLNFLDELRRRAPVGK
jgi:WD40 repeat protein